MYCDTTKMCSYVATCVQMSSAAVNNNTKLNVICPSNSLQHFFKFRKTEVIARAQGRLDEFVADLIKETEINKAKTKCHIKDSPNS